MVVVLWAERSVIKSRINVIAGGKPKAPCSQEYFSIGQVYRCIGFSVNIYIDPVSVLPFINNSRYGLDSLLCFGLRC